MEKTSFKPSPVTFIIIFALVDLFIHFYVNIFTEYGIFRDELYYIACSNRLDLGYVDQPPLSIYLLSISRSIFGDSSLFALRIFPSIASALTVFFTGLITFKLGGRLFAIALASIAVMLAPIQLGMNTIYSMNPFDILLWTLAFYFVIKLVKEENNRNWIYLGIIMGLGLLNKIGMAWFIIGFFLAILFTKHRRSYLTIYPYMTGIVALLIFLPYIIWNITHDFAHLEFIRNAVLYKYSSITRWDFISGLFLQQNPIAAIIWITGLYYFFFHKEGKSLRIVGIIFFTILMILLINGHSKSEYLSAAYPVLFAGGAFLIEDFLSGENFGWLKYALLVLIIFSGIILAPLAVPVLPVKTYIKYADALGFGPSTSENKELAELPQFYADMFGWEEMARSVAKVSDTLTEEEKEKTAIFANNYGEAGSMEYYKEKYNLPKVICAHNSYWIWGYPDMEIENVIIFGGNEDGHKEAFEIVKIAAIHKCNYCMPYENNLPIFLCKKLRTSIEDRWERIKHYD